jgi:hypothetical protein
MTPWLTPEQVLIVLVVWGVSVVAGYFLGQWKGRTVTGVLLTAVLSLPGLIILALCPRRGAAKTTAAPDFAEEPLTAADSIQPEWNETLAQTDSWIWRLPGNPHTQARGPRTNAAPSAHLCSDAGTVSSRSRAQTRAGAAAAGARRARRSACSQSRSR